MVRCAHSVLARSAHDLALIRYVNYHRWMEERRMAYSDETGHRLGDQNRQKEQSRLYGRVRQCYLEELREVVQSREEDEPAA